MDDHPYVTDKMKRQFWDNGVVVLEHVLPPTWIDLVELGVKRNLRNPGPYFQHHYEGTPRAFIDDYCNNTTVPEYQMLVECSPIAHIVASVLGTEQLWLFYDQIFVKDATDGQAPDPWHQDTTVLDDRWLTGRRLLDHPRRPPARESLEFVRGSAPRSDLRRHGLRPQRRDHAIRARRHHERIPDSSRPRQLRHRLLRRDPR